jgi:uncharacterized protein (DUF433 family)
MATALALPISYPHISKTPGVCGGIACIDGTRIRVMDIVCLEREGYRPEQMLNVFAAPLTLAQVHAALGYYYDHPAEIDASFAEDRRIVEESESTRAESPRERR